MDEEETCGVPEFEPAMNAVYSAWRELRAKPDSRMAEGRFNTAWTWLEQSMYQEKRRIWDELEKLARERE